MAISTLTAPPDLPDRTEQDQTVFDTRMAAYWAYFKEDFEPELNTITGEIDSTVTTINGYKDDAEAAKTGAELAETNAETAQSAAETARDVALSAVASSDTSATSNTSLTVGVGAKSLTIQTGKDFVVGMYVVIAYTTTPTTYMYGTITSYNSGTGDLAVNVTGVVGSGTQSEWTISLSGVPGETKSLNKVTIYDSAGTYTWTKDSATEVVEVEVIGGGAGGYCSASASDCGGPGGGGGYAYKFISSPNSSETVTVGAGGTGGTQGNSDNTDGGVSSFGSIVSAEGGVSSVADGWGVINTSPATGIDGDINLPASYPYTLRYNTSVSAVEFSVPGVPAKYSAPHLFPISLTSSSAGIYYGEGGAGSYDKGTPGTESAGAGKNGIVIVKEYK